MDTKWLEDFVTLARTGSFSKAAKQRKVTQPAFSRRIQALEVWLGCELIDRGVFPTRLSVQGNLFYEQALTMLEQIRQTRNLVRGGQVNLPGGEIHVTVPHTIAFSRCPVWFEGLRSGLSAAGKNVSFRLTARNVHDAVGFFVDGGCDFLVCFDHPMEPINFDEDKFEVRPLGREELKPYSKVQNGRPLYTIDPLASKPLPILRFVKHAYLSHMMEICFSNGPLFRHETIFQTDMSECLKAMCERGAGVAWLPTSTVGELFYSNLVALEGPYKTVIDVHLIRRKPKPEDEPLHAELLEQVWQLWPE